MKQNYNIQIKSDNNKCWKGCGFPRNDRIQIGAATLENFLTLSAKVDHSHTSWSSTSTPRHIYKKILAHV